MPRREQSLSARGGGARPRSGVNPGRVAAYARLALEAERYPDLLLDPLETPGMPERDQALAHAIYDAAVRRWITIRQLARTHLRQPWEALEPSVVAALLGGGTQLLFFDRIPPHAALDETVEWVKTAAPKASGLVNAVLRRLADAVRRQPGGEPVRRHAWTNAPDELPLADGSTLVLSGPALPDGEIPRAAAATGVPQWQVLHWTEHLGPDDALHVAWHSIAGAPVILNVEAAAAPPEGALVQPHHAPGHRVFVGPRAELLALLARHPEIWVQDSTSAAALSLYDGPAPGTIVDLCAGRGTKTRQILARFPNARVSACEVSEARLRDLARLAQTSGGRLEVGYPPEALRRLRARCDLILTDVPCSNSGVLARRLEARHRCSARQLARLNAQQKEILDAAVSLLAPGGHLLYSTCSLEPEENDRIVQWVRDTHGLELVRERLLIPAGGPGRPASEYRDGGYAALLARAPGGPRGPRGEIAGIH